MPFPIEEKYIRETEIKIGQKFPESFKKKMIKENGGEFIVNDIEWNLHPFLDKSDKKRISRTSNDIVYETKEKKNWPNFPKKAIAIGADGFGNALILKPKMFNKKKLDSKVYEWNHETGKLKMISKDFAYLVK